MKKPIFVILLLCFAAVIAYSGYRIWLIQDDYNREKQIRDIAMVYKPNVGIDLGDIQNMESQAEYIVNLSIVDLREAHPDAIGWITIPNTNIDYPFVQSGDNDYYLHRDINGDRAAVGSIFMEHNCSSDFSSPNTIIYGHHMKNESMFGTLKYFNDKTFFEQNEHGFIYLPYENLKLEFFAYMVVSPNDREIYSVELSDTYFDYVKQNARYYRELGLAEGDKIVTISTCAYEFDNARMVLLARVV